MQYQQLILSMGNLILIDMEILRLKIEVIFFENISPNVLLNIGDKIKFSILSGINDFLGKTSIIKVKVLNNNKRKITIKIN